MSTIYDIAKATGLSPATVSRALSGKGYCDPKTKKAIQEAAEALSYFPNQSAKILRTQKTGRIIFAIPDICNPFYFDMIAGANRVFEESGYYMILIYTKHNIKQELEAIRCLREKMADGMIMVSFNFTDENIREINSLDVPVVLTNKYVSKKNKDKFSYVYVDTLKGIKLATEHLISQGNKNIAYIGGLRTEQTGFERLMGFKEAMTENNLHINEEFIFEEDYTEKGGYRCGMEIIKHNTPPTAVVCANDLMAFGLMQACEESGIKIPDKIAVTGMDNTEISKKLNPKLTSVVMKQELIGVNAAKILTSRLDFRDENIKNVCLSPALEIRESSLYKR